MKKTKVVVTDTDVNRYQGPLLVYLISEQKSSAPLCDPLIEPVVKELYELGDVKGKNEETTIVHLNHRSATVACAAKRLLLVGIGGMDEETKPSQLKERVRAAGGSIAAVARQYKAESCLVVAPTFLPDHLGEGMEELCEGVLLGDYQFDKYKKKPEDESPFAGIKTLSFSVKDRKKARRAIRQAQVAAGATRTARDMAHEPGSSWTPEHFARFARQVGEMEHMKCRVLEKSHLQRSGMGGILGVNRGSAQPPKMIILDYQPPQHNTTILLVGKGITFDSGGVSLKPAAGMQDMKYDMCGGAAVLAVMQAIGEEKPPVRVIAVVPATDNMSGGDALKPGDIITHYNGITAEVINTDAEGRLILADALSYGIEKFKPDCVIDLATLTGAVIIGLGHHRTGLFSNHDQLAQLLLESGERVGEPLWRLPLGPEYSKQLESDVADVKNVGGKEGGAITAAAYLEKFVDKTPWAHLDIAGTAWDFTKKTYIPKGPSGIGVRTLLDFIRHWPKTSWDAGTAKQ